MIKMGIGKIMSKDKMICNSGKIVRPQQGRMTVQKGGRGRYGHEITDGKDGEGKIIGKDKEICNSQRW